MFSTHIYAKVRWARSLHTDVYEFAVYIMCFQCWQQSWWLDYAWANVIEKYSKINIKHAYTHIVTTEFVKKKTLPVCIVNYIVINTKATTASLAFSYICIMVFGNEIIIPYQYILIIGECVLVIFFLNDSHRMLHRIGSYFYDLRIYAKKKKIPTSFTAKWWEENGQGNTAMCCVVIGELMSMTLCI